MFLSEVAVKRPVTTMMFFAAIVLLGIVSVMRLPLQMLPDMSPPVGGLRVFTYEEYSAEEFERNFIEPLEGIVSQIPNIKNTRVFSDGENFAFFTLEFEFGTNVKYRVVELQDKANQFMREFPRNTMNVRAFQFETSRFNEEFMEVEIVGPRSDPHVEGVDIEKLRQQLINIDGVAEADLWGGRERTVDVQIMQDRLREFGVGMFNVRNTVETFAGEPVFLGEIEEGKQRYFVRFDGQFKDTGEIEDVIVKEEGNIAIRHLGEVNDYYRSRRQLRRHNGQPSINLELEKEADVNVLELSNRTHGVIAQINSELPPGYNIMVERDQADQIKDMLWTLSKLAMMGVVLSMFVLYLFVRNLKMTLIICVVIPICIVATFNLMYFSGMTINMLTLMGLAVGVGILIDSSIVVLENIFRHHEQGKSAMHSAVVGSHEVGIAVFALTLTNVVVFLPIIFIEGQIRIMFTEGALAIIYPMLISMIVALTLIPMGCSKILQFSRRKMRAKTLPAQIEAGSLAFAAPPVPVGVSQASKLLTMSNIKKQYGKILKSCLRHRVRLFLAIVMVCMYTYFYSMSRVNQDVLEPPPDHDWFQVYVYLPEGTKQDHTIEVVNAVEDIIIENVPERHHTGSRIDEDWAVIWTRLKDDREREQPEIKESLRPVFEAFASAEVSFNRRSRGDNAEPPVETGRSGMIEIRGPEYGQIQTIANTFIEQAENVPGVRDVQSQTEGGALEVNFILDRERAAHLQITPQSVAQAIQSAQRQGESSSIEMKKGDSEIMIVFSQVEELIDISELDNADEGLKFDELLRIPVFSPTVGGTISLSELGRFEIRRGMGQLQRENQERIGKIVFETAPDANFKEVETAMQTLMDNYPIKAGYRMSLGGRSRTIDENMQAFTQMIYLAFLLVYMCMASLFESFSKPLVVFLSVPLAIVGIVWMFIFTNTPFTETAALGALFLVGILPNSAILLVHYTSYLIRNYNYPRERAIMRSGYNRLRPIFMTVMTTCLGILPLAVDIRGSEEWTPFARCVIGGLLSSTVLTLIIVPGFYFIVEDLMKGIQVVMRYISSWRWIFVFWNKTSRTAYRQRITAYRQKPTPDEPLEIVVEYLVRIYQPPFLERMLGKIKRILSMNTYSTATGFIPQPVAAPSAHATQARTKALDGIHVNLGPGIYGLLGPNGAGKTTLLRLLAGIDQPTRGFLSVCGYDMKTNARDIQKLIGYLPQEFGVYTHLSAEKYLDYFALMKGIKTTAERKNAVDAALEMVNLNEQRHTPVGQFSGGMKRRIGLAQIFVKPPKVLIVDEPTVGLDPIERVRFRNLLVKLSQDRIVILSTHIVDDVAHTCKNVGVMNKGRLLFNGSTSNFVETVQGKVWQMTVPIEMTQGVNQDEWRAFRKTYQIVGQHHTADGIHLRVVADDAPRPDAVNAQPTLEDAYIYHTHVKAQ